MANRLLFISANIEIGQTGASVCSVRNLELCRRLLGKDNVICYNLQPFIYSNKSVFSKIHGIFIRLFRLLSGYTNGLSHKITCEIIRKIEEEKVNIVFIDSSLNGLLAKEIKAKTSVVVICFFHNCEKNMLLEHIKSGNRLSFFRFYAVKLNESATCRYADRIIALNQRDYNLILKYYNRKADALLPITLTDKAQNIPFKENKMRTRKTALFVGSYFFGNVEGLMYFINEVLPYIDIELLIVGKGMSRLSINNSKIKIFDNVESLDPFYINADFVIAPIVSGGGMKVKIAEAMMFGKIIVGTPEAFQGYENIPGLYVCKNTSEFIQTINSLHGNKFNCDIRKTFLEKYEINSSINVLSSILK